MKLIIDIDKDAYEEIKKIVANGNEMCFMQKAIANGIPLEDIKAEIETNRDEWIKGQDAEWHTYDRCLSIIDKHIGG